MGAGQPVATQATRYNGMQVQASQYGMGLPIVYGTQRIPGNLIWYGDFQSIEHQQSVGKGGGGTSTSYTYSSSFQLALCEGPIAGLGTIWDNSGITTLSDINGTFSTGTNSQAAWSHLSGAAALQYPNTAWVGCINLALGGSPNVPNFNWEIQGLLRYNPTGSPAIIDAEPSAIITDLLTSTTHGLAFTPYLGSLTQFQDYCVANSIFLSLKVNQQTTMNDILTRLLQLTNSQAAWADGQLTIIPYGDQSVTGNGVTYTPNTTVQKYFTDSDYIKPVQVTQKPSADLYNVVRLEWVDRSNNYNATVAEAKDQGDIDNSFGIRQQEMIQGHEVTNATLAQWIAQQILQRALYIRNKYVFTTTMENVAFQPGDVIALTDSLAELSNEPVRIVSVSEQNGNELQFTCEEFPAGVAVGATQTVEPGAGYIPNSQQVPDATQPAVIFRAPQFLNNGVPEVWLGVGSAGPNWGGANILVSLDNVSYQKIGTIAPGCRYGALTAALATSATDPDTVNSFSVALDAGGTLSGGSSTDADNLTTLMLIDQELIAYSATTLNGDGTYTLGTYLRRGCYGTTIASHAIGAPWLRVDNYFFRWQIDPSSVGDTAYIKIQPWNLYGGALVSEASITPITYVIGTAEEIPDTPPTPTGLTASGAANGVMLTWVTPNPAAVAITSVEYATVSTGPWTVLGQVQGTHYNHVFSGNATYYYRVRARSPAVIWSSYSSTASAAGGSLDYVSDGSTFVRLLASNSVGNVAYNFKGIWSSTTAYLTGDEVIEGQTCWLALAGNTNSLPSTSNANWQSLGSYSAYQGAWVSTTAYVAGSEVTYNGNYWICVTANTNSAPTTTNANWVIAGPSNLGFIADGTNRFAVTNGPGFKAVLSVDGNNRALIDFTQTAHIGKILDNIGDGTTYQRTLATALTSGQVDLSKAGVIGRTFANIGDGGGRFAVTNAGSLNGVSYVDAANRALIDFTQAAHVGKIIDNIGDGSTYGRTRLSAMYNNTPVLFQSIGSTLAAQSDTPTVGWAATTAYTLGALILDSGGNVEECVVAGTSAATVPTWPATQGGTVVDGSVTWMRVGAGSRFAVAYIDGAHRALIDFSQAGHINNNLDYIGNGSTYARVRALALDGSGNVDLSTGGVINKTLANIGDSVAAGRFAGVQAASTGDGYQVLSNPDFAGGSLSGYGVYDNNSTGNVTITGVTDATTPNSSGVYMQISTASGAAPTPGLGGFLLAIDPDSGSYAVNTYHRGATYIWRIRANIPVGYTLGWASNATGSTGSATWLTPVVGTGGWFEYVLQQNIGTTGTFSSTGFFYLAGTAPVTWAVAVCSLTCTSFPQGVGIPAGNVDSNRRALIDFSQGGHTNKSLTYIADGSGRYAVVNGGGLSAVSAVDGSNRALIDFSQAGHTNKTLSNIADGTGRYAVVNGAGLSAVSAVDGSNKALIDFSQAGHTNKTLDNIGDGTTYARPLATALTSGQVDLSKAGVINRTLANVVDAAGRYAVTNAGSLNGVSAVDAANKALIDFSQAGHTNKTADYIAAGASYAIPPLYTSGSNLVQNGTPTVGTSGSKLPGWTSGTSTTDTSPLGTASTLVAYGQNLASYGALNVQPFQAVAGEQYLVTAWIKTGGTGTWGLYFAGAGTSIGAPTAWTQVSHVWTVAAGTSSVELQFANSSATADSIEVWGLTCRKIIATTGGEIAPTGTIPPGASTVAFSYTSTTSSITWSWTAGAIYRMDGSSTSVGSGSQGITGLTASTTYNFGIYYDEIAGSIKLLTGGSGAVGSPLAAYTSQAAVNTAAIYAQTHAPFGWMTAATPASGSGSGGGSAGCCLHERQLIELARGEFVEAGALKEGDVLTSPEGSTPVVKLRIEPWYEWFRVTLRNGVTLRLAGDHRFIDPAGDQVLTRDLRLQQVVVTKHGYTAVSALEYISELGDKVSIEVGAPHVYYVDGILAHNKMFC